MKNSEVINGMAAIVEVGNAYDAIKGDVLDGYEFEQATCDLIEKICDENFSLKNAVSLNNAEEGNLGEIIGNVDIPLRLSTKIWSCLQKYMSKFICDERLRVDVKIDFSKPFSMLLNIKESVESASLLSLQLLLAMLTKNQALCFRCADFVSGGNFFSALYRMVSLFPEVTGGKIFTKQNEFSELINELEIIASKTMSKLGVMYSSVEDYNKLQTIKINQYISVIYMADFTYLSEDVNRLRILVENGKKNGMSFILIGRDEITKLFSEVVDFYIDCSENTMSMGRGVTFLLKEKKVICFQKMI